MSAGPPAPEPLPVRVPDVHCHLDLILDIRDTGARASSTSAGHAAPQSVADVVAQAAAVGVGPLVTIGIDVASSRWCADTAARNDDVYATVALHPNEVPVLAGQNTLDDALSAIEALASASAVRAVGETGLDHFRTDADGWAVQEHAFRAHIAIAKRHGKALVIHDRDAHDDVLRVLAEEGAPERTVFHCFSGDAAMARVCADRGYYLSFAGNVTFKNAAHLREAAAVAPLDRVLVETDAPFLTPDPHRGRPNAPYLIPHTVRALSAICRRPVGEMCVALASNASAAFGF